MKKKSSIQYRVIAVIGALLVIFAGLLASFDMAIYGDREYRFYEKEYEKYNVTEALGMELSDVMDVTEHMMAYLHGWEPELSVVTTVDARKQDFFNEQDRFHMEEVKNLFLGGLKLMYISFLTGMALLIWSGVKGEKGHTVVADAILQALGIFTVVTVALGVFCAVNFTQIFVIFHEIFFDNDLWLFDPATDYMIRMLPEGFFFDMVIRIGICFGGFLLLLLAGALFRKGVAGRSGKKNK